MTGKKTLQHLHIPRRTKEGCVLMTFCARQKRPSHKDSLHVRITVVKILINTFPNHDAGPYTARQSAMFNSKVLDPVSTEIPLRSKPLKVGHGFLPKELRVRIHVPRSSHLNLFLPLSVETCRQGQNATYIAR